MTDQKVSHVYPCCPNKKFDHAEYNITIDRKGCRYHPVVYLPALSKYFFFFLRSTIWTRIRIKYKFPTKRVKKYLTVIYTYVNFTLFYAGTALLNVLVFWISLDDKCKLLTSLFNALFVVVIMTIVYSKIPLILSTVPFIGKYHRSYCVNNHFAFITDIPARTTNVIMRENIV